MKWINTSTEEYYVFADTDIGTFYIYNNYLLNKVSLYFNSVFITYTNTSAQAKSIAKDYLITC